jgi:ATP/maltotriose-dependent transcriptional regulator MalT
MRTSLTVDEASKMLDELARKGHLEMQTDEGIVAYALSEHNKRELTGQDPVALRAQSGTNGASLRLEDPLSERELEVLGLLASGKTNSEVAGDLFVSVGTVKSHTGNIYRKLGARNRTEALARARELGLIR